MYMTLEGAPLKAYAKLRGLPADSSQSQIAARLVTQDERNATQPQDQHQIEATQQVMCEAKVPHSHPASTTYDEDAWEVIGAVTNIKKRAHDESKLAKSNDFRSSTIDHRAADSSSIVGSDENQLTSNLSTSMILEDRLEPKTSAVSQFEQENATGKDSGAHGLEESKKKRKRGKKGGKKARKNAAMDADRCEGGAPEEALAGTELSEDIRCQFSEPDMSHLLPINKGFVGNNVDLCLKVQDVSGLHVAKEDRSEPCLEASPSVTATQMEELINPLAVQMLDHPFEDEATQGRQCLSVQHSVATLVEGISSTTIATAADVHVNAAAENTAWEEPKKQADKIRTSGQGSMRSEDVHTSLNGSDIGGLTAPTPGDENTTELDLLQHAWERSTDIARAESHNKRHARGKKGCKNARKQTADQVVRAGKVKLNMPYLAASAGLGASVVVAVTVAAFFASKM